MGFYEHRILPRIMNRMCGAGANGPLRQRVCDGLAGEVLEIGFGSGHNVPHYPAGIERVVAIEPTDLSWELAASRRGASPVPIERSGLDAESLPFDDDRFDMALSTWTLCSVRDPVVALEELRRVLRPGGTLHFLEHGLAPDEKVRRWQRRMDPIQRRIAGGCHFSRPIVDLLTRAGFEIKELDVFYQDGAPKFAGADSLGVAVSA